MLKTTTKKAVDLSTGDMVVKHDGSTWEVQCVDTGDGVTLPVTLTPLEGPEVTLPFGVEADVSVAADTVI